MLYNDLILSKRGPLARIWIAAHIEKKLSKKEAINTDIGQSVDVILNPQAVEPMALRMSGQLLLGVTRIHSRKARYLLEDVTDALTSLRKAFMPGPGAIDLTDHQLTAPQQAITFPIDDNLNYENGIDFEILNFENRIDLNQLLGGPSDFDLMSSGGISTNDFMSDDLSIERGRRDSSVARSDRMSILNESELGIDNSKQNLEVDEWGMPIEGIRNNFETDDNNDVLATENNEGNMDLDLGGGFDGGVDLGFNFDEPLLEPQQSTPRQSSILSTPPPPNVEADEEGDQLNDDQNQVIDTNTSVKKSAASRKKHIIDSRTQLSRNINEENVESTFQPEQYLQKSSVYQEQIQVLQNPLNYFINVDESRGKQNLRVAPPNILSENLRSLYDVPVGCLRKRSQSPDSANKRPRDEIEFGRERQSSEQPEIIDEDGWNLTGLDIGLGDESAFQNQDDEQTFQLDENNLFENEPLDAPLANDQEQQQPYEQQGDVLSSRFSTPTVDFSSSQAELDESNCAISMFGKKQSKQDSKQSTTDGYSQMTVKARDFIKGYVNNNTNDQMSFKDVSTNANKRAASGFFFELLVLGNRHQIDLNQSKPFDDIKIRANDELLT